MDSLQKRIEDLEKQISNIITNKYIENLKTDGFVVIPSVLTSEEVDIAKSMFYKLLIFIE